MSIEPDSTSPPRSVVIILIAAWAILSINLGITVARFQPNVLTWDQWNFFNPLFSGSGWRELFTLQHGPHRQGLGFVVTSWILAATDWDSRWDSLWIASLLSVACLLALRLRWKLTDRLSVFDLWIPIVGLSLGQSEAVLITPNSSHSAFPLFLMLVVANLWLDRRPVVRYFAGGLGAFGLIFTGFGIFACLVLVALLASSVVRHLIARDWQPAVLATLGLGIAVWGGIAFAHGYVFAPAVDGFKFPWTPVTDYGRFILLMLVHPAGVNGESGLHYVGGGLLAVLLLIAAVVSLRRWLTTTKSSPQTDVIIFLLGAGLLFVCNTAVGRIPLGVTAGMSSRYVTLIFPAWLGLYFAAATTKRSGPFAIVTLALAGIAIWPYRDMPGRPRSQWPGTIGATKDQYIFFEEYTVRKAAWADTYLKTGRWEDAQEVAGDAVYPNPSVTNMDEKLEFLRKHQLSLFKPPGGPAAILPWLLKHRTIWDLEYPSINVSHPLEQRARTITYITRTPTYIEIEVRSGATRSTSPFDLEFSMNGRSQALTFSKLPERVAVPVRPGFNRIMVRRSTTGGTESANLPIQLEMDTIAGPATGQRAVLE